MRSFPGAPSHRPRRPQRVALLVAGAVAVGGLVAPTAMAKDDEDDLRDQQHQVEDQIDQAQHDIDEASHEVASTTRRLERAVGRLSSARQHLQAVRADLQDARALQRQLARALVRAQGRLDRVALELKAARAEVARQRKLVRDTVLGIETRGNADLAVLDAITSSGSIQELLVAGTAGSMILGREDQALAAYETAEAELADWKAQVRAARDEVAAQKQAARDNLRHIQGLYADAQHTRVQVRDLVEGARHARAAAVNARKNDRAALQRLQDREQRIKQQILQLVQQQQDDSPTYSGDTGGLLHLPVDGPVTSPFGYREHPIYHYWGLHNGTDFGAPCGADLWAAESGTVINEYYDEVYGNRLYLNIGTVNGSNITVVYNHLSAYDVSEGDHVTRGQVVGAVGETGWATGCHLHFIVMKDGVPVDPMGYL
ncbi:peptidoglycan DD-metalloendopeptidase family protein [Nocardioides humilatus]|uniref:Peptidoglycan DD-metalloendopeptidase family protein n=1 Tax=Nocardioides humilatus TaxID=2607660 RepID=A0A5B1LGW5_9ACTN|nr:M23 family metallopeptidase [Nocardioides humilatus]KAA1418899.1 peptidoglycan DD-metalloendopeptidase family protein [Nocardioides humilatus]